MNELHLTDEQLSAHLDGVAPDDTAHLATCDRCASRLADLGRAAAAVRAAPAAPPGARAAAVSAALAAAGAAPERSLGDIRPLPAARRPRPPWVLAAAAVAALVLVAVPVLIAVNRKPAGRTSAASRATAAQESASRATSAGDLGDLADPVALRSAVGTALGGGTASTAAGASSGAAGATAAPSAAAPSPSASDFAKRTPPSGVIVHPACDTAVRQSYGNGLGPLEITATLRWQQTPSTLLVYALAGAGGKPIRHRAFVMASADCHLLVVQSL